MRPGREDLSDVSTVHFGLIDRKFVILTDVLI